MPFSTHEDRKQLGVGLAQNGVWASFVQEPQVRAEIRFSGSEKQFRIIAKRVIRMRLAIQALSSLAVVVVIGTGCAGFPSHRLPEVGELAPPGDQSRAVSGSYEFKWRPAAGRESDMPQRDLEHYAKEFGDTLKESGYFVSLRPGKGESVHIDARMESYGNNIGTAMKIWASVCGLSLTTIPCWVSDGYRAKVVVTTKEGISKEYNLDEAETAVFWFPLVVATPFTNPARVSKQVRKNIYKTLILRMQEDGILPPAKTGIHAEKEMHSGQVNAFA